MNHASPQVRMPPASSRGSAVTATAHSPTNKTIDAYAPWWMIVGTPPPHTSTTHTANASSVKTASGLRSARARLADGISSAAAPSSSGPVAGSTL
jgi:hypothetical protein